MVKFTVRRKINSEFGTCIYLKASNYQNDLIKLKALISIWKMKYLGVFALTLVLLFIRIQARPEKSFIFMFFLQNKILIIDFKNPMLKKRDVSQGIVLSVCCS